VIIWLWYGGIQPQGALKRRSGIAQSINLMGGEPRSPERYRCASVGQSEVCHAHPFPYWNACDTSRVFILT